MIKLRSKRFCIKFGCGVASFKGQDEKIYDEHTQIDTSETKWELRPGGLLVQKRENGVNLDLIQLRVSTLSQWHQISIQSTSTFGELKIILSLVTGLEAKEQRLVYKGKEREDYEYLHMVGVVDKDKILLLQDPAIKEMKLHGMPRGQPISV